MSAPFLHFLPGSSARPAAESADPLRTAVESALARLRARAAAPRVLGLRPDDRALLERAAERAAAQLLSGPEPTLTVALAGGTGAGKSSLINALAGSAIAEATPRRPTTTRLRVYHHRDVASGGLPPEPAAQAAYVAHDRPELRNKVLVDTPDLDSFATEHRALSKQLLKAAGLVLYVFNPQNYRDERVWGVLAEERRFSRAAAVLNKADLVTVEELEAITEDLRGCFARVGVPEVRVFRTVAVAAASSTTPTSGAAAASSAVNDLPALRAYLERELQASDIAQMLAAQRGRVVEHLAAEVGRVAPRELTGRFDRIADEARVRLSATAAALTEQLAGRLSAVEQELGPVTVLRQHERFAGPLRTWLAVMDFLRFGLGGIVRQVNGRGPRGSRTNVEEILLAGPSGPVEDLLRGECQVVQDRLFAAGLPVGRWAEESARIEPARLMGAVAAEIDNRFESAVTDAAGRGGWVVRIGSWLGMLGPAAAVGFGLYVSVRQLLAADPTQLNALPLLGHLAAMTAFYFLALQWLTGMLLPSPQRLATGLASRTAADVLGRILGRMLDRYRADLEADLADLHEPLAALRTATQSRGEGPGTRGDVSELGTSATGGARRESPPRADEPRGAAPPAARASTEAPPTQVNPPAMVSDQPPTTNNQQPTAGPQTLDSNHQTPSAPLNPPIDLAARLRQAELRRLGQ